MEVRTNGLKCDNTKCDWRDETVDIADWGLWVDKGCPKCGESVLTLEDYKNFLLMKEIIKLAEELETEESSDETMVTSTITFKNGKIEMGEIKKIE